MAEDKEYKQIFEMLLTQAEDEVVEFKTAENQFDRDKMGRYFSALSNEANLHDKDFAWLVLGVTNGKSLVPLSQDKIDDIRYQSPVSDCSARHQRAHGKETIFGQNPCKNG